MVHCLSVPSPDAVLTEIEQYVYQTSKNTNIQKINITFGSFPDFSFLISYRFYTNTQRTLPGLRVYQNMSNAGVEPTPIALCCIEWHIDINSLKG